MAGGEGVTTGQPNLYKQDLANLDVTKPTALSTEVISKQINMEGGQSGTYLRLTRVSSGPRVSVAKTYRDEMKRKLILRPDHSGESPVFYC